MATEEVMIDYDMQNPKKKKSKPKTSVMKKKQNKLGLLNICVFFL